MDSLYLKSQAYGTLHENADKIIEIAERLYEESTEVSHKYSVIWNLCRLYTSLGNEEKALEYAYQAPIMDITNANLLSLILKGEKAVEHIQHNLFAFVYLAYNQINTMAMQGNFSNSDRRKAYRCSLDLINWLHEDGDYGFLATRVANIYADLAFCDATDKNADGVINNFALSAEYEIKFHTQESFQHTSFLANRRFHEKGRSYPNTVDNDLKILLNRMKEPLFDFCREREDFKAIESELEKYAN